MLVKRMGNDLENMNMAPSTNEKKFGSRKMVLGVFTHIIFGAIIMVGYIAYVGKRMDNVEWSFWASGFLIWFLIYVLPFLIIGSILIFFFLRNKFKFSTILIIGCSIEIILAVLLPISDELSHKKLENYRVAQNNKTIEERTTVLPNIKDIDDCSILTTYTTWKECIQAHLKTKQDFESCRTQEWGQFRDATKYHGDVAMAEYYSKNYRSDDCQKAYNPIGATTATKVEDCFDLGGITWVECINRTVQSEADLATCNRLEAQPSWKWGDGYNCNLAWTARQKQVILCDNASWPSSATDECIKNIISFVDITDVFHQCSNLSSAELRSGCVGPTLIKISNNVELQRKYNNNIAKDLCSLVDESHPDPYLPGKNFCTNLRLNNYYQ